MTPAAGASATSPAANAAARPAAPTAGATPPAAARPGEPAPLRPFAEVIKDAKQQDGFIPVWRKDERVWLEIPAAMLGKPFFFTWNIAQSVGERGLYASQMGRDFLVEWRRVGNQLQLVALNTQFRAEGGGRVAAQQAFSPSLLVSGAVASAEHPERKSVLVDASMFIGDLPAL
ncbi:MAG: DUF5118 domain-containing protein, partial [Betaproteobacteria bacterium]